MFNSETINIILANIARLRTFGTQDLGLNSILLSGTNLKLSNIYLNIFVHRGTQSRYRLSLLRFSRDLGMHIAVMPMQFVLSASLHYYWR